MFIVCSTCVPVEAAFFTVPDGYFPIAKYYPSTGWYPSNNMGIENYDSWLEKHTHEHGLWGGSQFRLEHETLDK